MSSHLLHLQQYFKSRMFVEISGLTELESYRGTRNSRKQWNLKLSLVENAVHYIEVLKYLIFCIL